jgi:hypothetical protein
LYPSNAEPPFEGACHSIFTDIPKKIVFGDIGASGI